MGANHDCRYRAAGPGHDVPQRSPVLLSQAVEVDNQERGLQRFLWRTERGRLRALGQKPNH